MVCRSCLLFRVYILYFDIFNRFYGSLGGRSGINRTRWELVGLSWSFRTSTSDWVASMRKSECENLTGRGPSSIRNLIRVRKEFECKS